MSTTTQRILIESTALAELPARVPLLPVPGEYEHPLYGMMDLSTERLSRFVQNHNARIYQQHIPIDAEHETKLSGALGYLGDAEVADDGQLHLGLGRSRPGSGQQARKTRMTSFGVSRSTSDQASR